MSINSTPAVNGGRPPTLNRVGALPSVTTPGTYSAVPGLSVKEYGDGPVRQTVIRLDGVVVTMTDATTNNGNVPLYAPPRGSLYILGGTANFASKANSTGPADVIEPYTNTFGIAAGSGGIADGAALVIGVGTTVSAGATLTTTEQNIVASTAATLTAGVNNGIVAAVTAGAHVAGLSTGGAQSFWYLNFAVPDADTTANDTITVTGEIIVNWILLGNY